MKNRVKYLIRLLFLLSSCLSEREQEVVTLLTQRLNAQVRMSFGFSSGVKNFIEVSVKNPELVLPVDDELAAGFVALETYNGLEEKHKQEYENIRVEISRRGKKLERQYKMSSMPKINDLIAFCDRYFKARESRNFSNILALTDRKVFDNAKVNALKTNIARIESVTGHLVVYTQKGWKPLNYNGTSCFQAAFLADYQSNEPGNESTHIFEEVLTVNVTPSGYAILDISVERSNRPGDKYY